MAITPITEGMSGAAAAAVIFNNDTELETAGQESRAYINTQKALFFSKRDASIVYDPATKTITSDGDIYVFNGADTYIRITAGSVSMSAAIAGTPTANFFYVYTTFPQNWFTASGGSGSLSQAFSDLSVAAFSNASAVRANNAVVLFTYNKTADKIDSPFFSEDLYDILKPDAPFYGDYIQTNKTLSYVMGPSLFVVDSVAHTITLTDPVYIFAGTTGAYLRVSAGTINMAPGIEASPTSAYLYVYADLSANSTFKDFTKGAVASGGITAASIVTKGYLDPTLNIRHPSNVLLGIYNKNTGEFISPFMVDKITSLLEGTDPLSVDLTTRRVLNFGSRGSFSYNKSTGVLTWSDRIYIFNNVKVGSNTYYMYCEAGSYDFKAAAEAVAPTPGWVTFYIKVPARFLSGVGTPTTIPFDMGDALLAKNWNSDGVNDIREKDSVVLFKYDMFTGALWSPWFEGLAQLNALDPTPVAPRLPWVNSFPNAYQHLKDFIAKYSNLSGGDAEDPTRIILLGDSIFARANHTSALGVVPSSSPPTLVTKNIGAYMWEYIQGNKPTYRRFDAPGAFAETGTWVTATDLSIWDDAGDINTATRRSTSTNAAAQFTVESGVEYFNLIDRTDSEGSTSVLVTVTGGTGRVEVLNDSGDWVEAHNYTFSQRNPAANVSQGRGNTVYQRRIRFRKVSAEQTITISKSASNSDALMYWGIEVAEVNRPYTQLINVARGGHNISQLKRYVQTDVYDRKPDLVIFEVPLINQYNDETSLSAIVNAVQDFIYGDRPGSPEPLSLKTKSNDWADFQVLVVIPNFTRANYNSSNQFVRNVDGYTAEDVYKAVKGLIIQKGEVGLIDMSSYINYQIAADPLYNGDVYAAMTGTNATGATYTTDGTHPNNKGTEVYAKALCPFFALTGN